MLEVKNLRSAYGRIEVIHGLDLTVGAREIVTIVGANGAGKTTLLRAISGVQPCTEGTVLFEGQPIHRLPPHRRLRLGIAQVPEGRQIFAPLIVEDNLRLGAWCRTDREIADDIEEIYTLFPILKEKRHLVAGGLSGGQQQMLAIGRALMSRPRLLLLDEPSMGLAPILVDQVFEVIKSRTATGMSILLVEQNAAAALGIADRGYVIETGRVTIEGTADNLVHDPKVAAAYLGV